MNGWIYSAVLLSMVAGVIGAVAGALVFRRVILAPAERRPVLGWLLLCLATMALAQVIEQSRVLFFRLSYDGLLDREIFGDLYDTTWNVVSSKVMAASAMVTAATIKFALWRRIPERQVVCWAARAATATVVVWLLLGLLFETIF